MDNAQLRVALARLLADPQTVPLLIDRLPDPEAITLLKAWRQITFGPASAAEGADPAPAAGSDTEEHPTPEA